MHRGKFVQEIEEQADRLNQLISDLLNLARIEQGQEELEVSSLLVKRVADLCVREQRRAAEAARIDLILEGGAEDASVEANEDRVRQILINLIDNAIKYTPEGGSVTVRWRQEGRQVAIDVVDTGIGIAPELLPRVFERFFRVDKARSREMGGTGLGLAIVKHLAQSCGGSVDVSSEPGKGSQFTVKLPSPSNPPARPR